MKKIKALTNYYDLQLNKTIKPGDTYEVSDDRAAVLTTKNNTANTVMAEIVEAPTLTTAKKVDKVAKKSKTESIK